MIYPVNYIGITCDWHQGKCLDFGYNLLHGGSKQPVLAVDDAIVYSVETQPKGGKVIYLKHNDGKCSCYAHLSKVLVKKNQKVKMGEQIGNMGDTGECTGPHLHFGLFTSVSVRYKNSTLDPFKYLEVYEKQTVGSKTKTKYGDRMKYHQNEEIRYVYNVDDEGLVVHKSPAGANTGELLKAGTQVIVYENQGYWSKIGENKWVWSLNLSKKKPDVKTVYNVKNPPLLVRTKPEVSDKSKVVGKLYNGDTVQVYKTKNGWSKTSKTEDRWCSSKYLK